jgi:hypothetical protein
VSSTDDAKQRRVDGPGPETAAPPEEGAITDVPPSVRDAARRAFDVRRTDVTVADLVFDSLVDEDAGAGDTAVARRLRFGTEEGGVDLVVSEQDERIDVSLQLWPSQPAEIEASASQGVVKVQTDERGHAALELTPGLASFLVRPTRAPSRQPLQTAWVRL